jgi:hypothetical protein
MTTVLEECITEEQRSVVRLSCGEKDGADVSCSLGRKRFSGDEQIETEYGNG